LLLKQEALIIVETTKTITIILEIEVGLKIECRHALLLYYIILIYSAIYTNAIDTPLKNALVIKKHSKIRRIL